MDGWNKIHRSLDNKTVSKTKNKQVGKDIMSEGKLTKKQWFEAFNHHLMEDAVPSVYFYDLARDKQFPAQYPFSMLTDLMDLQQSPVHHPEGDVFVHTMLVVDNAAGRRFLSKAPQVLMWAALLHDLGKKPTTKRRKGRITAYDHDKAGRQMAERFLIECGQDESFAKKVAALVRWHMQALFVIRNLPFSNLDRMTFGGGYRGDRAACPL